MKFRTYLEVLLTTRLDTLGRGQGKPPHFWAEVRGGPAYGEKGPHYLACLDSSGAERELNPHTKRPA